MATLVKIRNYLSSYSATPKIHIGQISCHQLAQLCPDYGWAENLPSIERCHVVSFYLPTLKTRQNTEDLTILTANDSLSPFENGFLDRVIESA